MQIINYRQAVQYLESFIGKVLYKIDPEYLKHHDPLERMRVLLDLLGNPQEKFPSILIGGTSGKGSTAYLISHILTTAGYKTGLTISPHLQEINERIQINGRSISNGEFKSLLTSILSSIEGMKRMSVGAPSYFEILIGIAFVYFAEQKVDIAVVEVGMGGEFDATNTLYPLIAVLTNVSLDHTNVLGGTVQKIAKTKAGIIKDHSSLRSLRQFKNFSNASVPAARYRSPRDTVAFGDSSEKFFHAKAPRELMQSLVVVTGVKQPSVIKIVEDRCKEVGVELFRLEKDFVYKIKKESLEGSVFDLTTACDRIRQLNDLNLSLLGRYQVENASLAIATILQLRKFGFKISEEHIKKALSTAFFPGRFEIVCFKGWPRPLNDSSNPNLKQSADLARANGFEHESEGALFKSSFRGEAHPSISVARRNYILVIDGAHNSTKMRAFLSALKKLYPRNPKIFVVAFKSDKDIKGMLRQILKVADTLIATEFRAKTDMNTNASADALNLKSQISKLKTNVGIMVKKDSEKALEEAIKISKSETNSIIVVTGSLYLVGEVRSYLSQIIRQPTDNFQNSNI